MLIGHGIDIVEIDRFCRLFTPLTLPYLDRYFTENELVYVGVSINRIQKLAARFAAKEAVLKALGLGWGGGISYTDVEVKTLRSGAPSIVLDRSLKSHSDALGISSWSVSISHTELFAVASVIAIGNTKID